MPKLASSGSAASFISYNRPSSSPTASSAHSRKKPSSSDSPLTASASPSEQKDPDELKLHGRHGARRLILSHLLGTLFTFVATYLLSYHGFRSATPSSPLFIPVRQVNVTDFHLSTSIDYGIARCLGGVGLPLCGFGFLLIALWRYMYVHAYLPSRHGAYTLFPHKRNNLSLLCAAVGGLSASGVSAFPSAVHKPTHFFFAFSCFGNLCAYMVLQCWLDRSLKLYRLNSTERVLHLARCALAAFCNAALWGMIIAMKGFKMKALSSTFELLLATGFMLFLMTFANQLQHVNITISCSISSGTVGGAAKTAKTLSLGTTLEIERPEGGGDEGGGGGAEGERGGGDTSIGPYDREGARGDDDYHDDRDRDGDGDDEAFTTSWAAGVGAGGKGGGRVRRRGGSWGSWDEGENDGGDRARSEKGGKMEDGSPRHSGIGVRSSSGDKVDESARGRRTFSFTKVSKIGLDLLDDLGVVSSTDEKEDSKVD